MIKNKVRVDRIIAKQEYSLKTDSRGIIIERSPIPKDNDFLYSKLSDVFKKWGHLVKFEELGSEPYPKAPEQIYTEMIDKNPLLSTLKQKFNCEIY